MIMVVFDVKKLREKLDEWLESSPKNNYTLLGKKVGRSQGYIQQVCDRGTIREGDLHKLCQVISADYEDLTTIKKGTDMEILDEYFTIQGRQMAIDDYIRTLDGDNEDDEPEEDLIVQRTRETSPVRAQIMINHELDNWLREKAWENRTSFSGFVRGILQEYKNTHQ